jgi:hypothetical protein
MRWLGLLLESIHVNIVDDFKSMFFKDRKRIFFIQAKRDCKHLFFSSIKQKERIPKRIWNFSFQTENFLCLFLIIIIIIIITTTTTTIYYFYDFLSKSSMYCCFVCLAFQFPFYTLLENLMHMSHLYGSWPASLSAVSFLFILL